MLALGVREGDRIRIGGDTWLKVVRIHRGQVILGFEAPREIEIVRERALAKREEVPNALPVVPGEGVRCRRGVRGGAVPGLFPVGAVRVPSAVPQPGPGARDGQDQRSG